jgi:site-specific recombinase XerC
VAAAGAPTVGQTIDEFLAAVNRGSARDRYGRPFTPEAADELHWWLQGHVAERLGGMDLARLRRDEVEALVYELRNSGLSSRRLRGLAKSVRALYDYAAEQDLLRHNPAERIAIPDEDEAEQPATGEVRHDRVGPRAAITDRAITLAVRLGTLGFALVALILLTESL